MTRATLTPETQQRTRLAAAEQALAEALALNAELHQQLDRANRATVRMAQRAAGVLARRAA